MISIKIIKNILLGFVLISIGFALGKNFTKANVESSNKTHFDDNTTSLFIHVYYFHSTFRCSTCNKIEDMTINLLDTKYSKELKNREIVFSEENFQTNNNLAKKFNIVSSCVVVAIEKNKNILEFIKLDDVWTKIENHKDFDHYISNTINNLIEKKTYLINKQ